MVLPIPPVPKDWIVYGAGSLGLIVRPEDGMKVEYGGKVVMRIKKAPKHEAPPQIELSPAMRAEVRNDSPRFQIGLHEVSDIAIFMRVAEEQFVTCDAGGELA